MQNVKCKMYNNAYCTGCGHWHHFGGFYGCYKFRIFKLAEFEQLCGGRYRIPRPPDYQLYISPKKVKT